MRFWLACALFLAALPAFSQGSRSTGGASPDHGSFSVLRQVTGVLVSADEGEGTLSVKPEGASESIAFKIGDRIRLSAERKTPLAALTASGLSMRLR